MKYSVLTLLMASTIAVATAQTPAMAASKPAASVAKHTAASAGIKLPPGVPLVKGVVKTAFSLRYQEIKIGTGVDAEPNKLYKVHYTGWRAADGVKFDSSYDHPGQPLKDKDGKPVLGDDGKPKLGDPQPIVFPQGMTMGRLIPGFDQGFAGMKVGGQRRLFIPWQLAYGTHAIPEHGPGHPGIPAKSDLIFDVELVDMADIPVPQAHPDMPKGHPTPGANVPSKPDVPASSAAPSTPAAAPATAPNSATPTAPAASTQPQAK